MGLQEGQEAGFSTKCVHAGQPADPRTGAVMVPISLATTFAQPTPGHPKIAGMDYSRSANPTRNAFEECIAAVENGKHGFAFASGSAATVTVFHLLEKGDHLLSIDDVYGGTQRYFRRVAAHHGGEFTFADLTQPEELEKNIKPNTKMIWLESPTNPTLKIADIRAICDTVHTKYASQKIIVVVDGTFMSPYGMRALDLGADIVYHSITKYINGHSDVVGGVVVTRNDEIASRLRFLQNSIGAILSPFDSYMAMRGLKTLPLRMRQHEQSAMKIAKFLEAHPKVERVVYPGLPSHPQHELAKKQFHCFGGMITFFVKGGLDEARTFLENTHLIALAESLGGVESLIEHPALMTHASVPQEERIKLGISDTLIRLSCGIEDTDDLLAEITRCLDAIGSEPAGKKARHH